MCVCVHVWGLRTKAGNSFVSFRFFSYFLTARAEGGSLPKWPSSNSSDIFRQLSDSQVWHPQHKAKVKWHRRSHRAGWAGNCQPATGSRQQFCSNPKSMQQFFVSLYFLFVSFSFFLMQHEGGRVRVRQPPRQTAANPLTQPTRRRRRRQLLLIIKSLSIKA